MPLRPPSEPPLPTGGPAEDANLVVEAPGAEEVGVAPWPELWRRRMSARVERSPHYAWIVLATALFGLFSVGFTITILSLSIPTIADDLDSPRSLLTWLVTGPVLAFAIFGPTAGKLADLHGSRRVYLWSLGGAIVFAGLTAISWNGISLVAFRLLGGTVGAATGPASMAVINRVFPRDQRVKAMGYWSMVAAGGPVIGAVLGGPIVENLSWRWIFVAQVPVTLACWLVAYGIYPETQRAARTRFDIAGSVTLAASVAALLVGAQTGASQGLASPMPLIAFAAVPVLVAAFVRAERRAENPLIPLEYFRRRNFAIPIATQFILQFTYMGGFLLTGLLLQDALGYSVSETSLISIIRPFTFAVFGPLTGYLAVRLGERSMAVTGAVALVASMLLMTGVDVDTSVAYILVALALSGVGLGASSPSIASSVANAVDEADLGIAGASQQMASQVGTAIGMQALVSIQMAAGSESDVGAFHTAYLAGAGFACLGVITAAFVRSLPRDAAGNAIDGDEAGGRGAAARTRRGGASDGAPDGSELEHA